MPRVKFINDTGKPITFWLSNEKSDFELRNFEASRELKDQMFVLGDGRTRPEGREGPPKTLESVQTVLGAEKTPLNACLWHLLSSHDNEDLNRAQIYLNVAIDSRYHMLNNISLFQTGLFGYKLKKRSKRQKSQYCLLRMFRTGNETTVHFESIAVVFNNTRYDLQLTPFKPEDRPRVFQDADRLSLPPNDVTVLPLTWFEEGYQAVVSEEKKEERDLEAFDVAQGERRVEEEHESCFVFKNGLITKVLNPVITEPYADHAS